MKMGSIVGTVRGHNAPDGFYIGRLAVLPQWQGRGMGTALLEAAIAIAEACRLVLFTSTKK